MLKRLAQGKQSGDRLFGDVDRFWVRHSVRRLCRLAGVRLVSPHSLRGTHGRLLAVEAGISGDVVAASLGHESFAVTENHYAKAEAVIGARTERVETSLRKFRKSSASDREAA